MDTSGFDYELPGELIAQSPLPRRGESRLLVLEKATGQSSHRRFDLLPGLLRPDDVLVFNDPRVIPARLYGRKPTGGRAELLLVKQLGPRTWTALAHPGLRPGQSLRIVPRTTDASDAPDEQIARASSAGSASLSPDNAPPALRATVRSVDGGGLRVIDFDLEDGALRSAIWRLGEMPTPPYVKRHLDRPEDYQTVYASVEGSIAAPTAGLHFTPDLLGQLRARGIQLEFLTLHIGLGTFQPVKVTDVESHRMHREWLEVPADLACRLTKARKAGRRVVAVGTTTVRALESAGTTDGEVVPTSGETALFIYPGYRFKVVDALVTNFHLPRSTLLMLVCAFAGRETVLGAYSEAVKCGYRFYSFGDAMLIH